MKKYSILLVTLILLSVIFACSMKESARQSDKINENKQSDKINENRQAARANEDRQAAGINENFESGNKGAYASGTVSLSSGNWQFEDAIVGNQADDRKNGSKAVRIRNNGKITMQFDKNNGAGTFQVWHGQYGQDAASTWELWYSVDQGKSWKKAGNATTSGSTSLQQASIAVNVQGKVRFEIRKTSGGSARINLDDVSISDFGSGDSQPGDTANGSNSSGGSNTAPNTAGGSVSDREVQPLPPGDAQSLHMALGNPSSAGTDPGRSPDNYLMVKQQYVLSYNRSRGIPNWVSWYLDKSLMGNVKRQNDFSPDNTLPRGWYQVTNNDYNGSGFDRGHNCPSGDRTVRPADNSSTFLMTNIMPQAADNNQGPWEKLESYCRELAQEGNRLYIICGNYGTGGTGLKGYKTTIANGKVTVPAQTWKVVVVLPSGGNLNSVNTSTRVIAIDIPNKLGMKNKDWEEYKVSVDAIEQKTGYDLLSAVPKAIQDKLEQ